MSSAFNNSALLRVWLAGGGTKESFLAHKPRALDDYEQDALAAAGVLVNERTRAFFARAKALLGERNFAELAGTLKEAAVLGTGTARDNPTGSLIRLLLKRISLKVSKPCADNGKPQSQPPMNPKATTTDAAQPPPCVVVTSQKRRQEQLAQGIQERSAQHRDRIGFTAGALAQVNLPHSDPGDALEVWTKKNGDWHFMLQPGKRIADDGKLQSIGYPFGVLPRLTLIAFITKAVRTRSPLIELDNSLYGFLQRLGVTDSSKNYKALRAQLTRLVSANMRYYRESTCVNAAGKTMTGEQSFISPIARKYSLWWSEKAFEPDQATLFPSYVELDHEFYESVVAVTGRNLTYPIDLDVVAAIRESSVQLDLYAWLSYRVFCLRASGRPEMLVDWSALHDQFGSNYASMRSFRQRFIGNLEHVKKYWRGGLLYEPSPDGLIVRPGPLSVDPTNAIDLPLFNGKPLIS